jgi:prepilin-type N-terminal cleavage/methylation domain-containing protein
MTPQPVRRIRHRVALATHLDDGFTLIEVLVSFVLFVIVSTSATFAIVAALHASHTSQQRIDASNVAQRFMADQQQNAQRAVNGSATYPASVKNEDFNVQRTISFFYGSTQCNPGGSYAVNVEVSQMQKDGNYRLLARSDSVITC